MKKLIVSVLCLYISVVACSAGPNWMDLPVAYATGYDPAYAYLKDNGEGSMSLSNFLKKLNPGSWSKIEDDVWMYSINVVDKVTNQTTSIKCVFTKVKGNLGEVVVLGRINVDGEDIPILNTLYGWGILRVK